MGEQWPYHIYDTPFNSAVNSSRISVLNALVIVRYLRSWANRARQVVKNMKLFKPLKKGYYRAYSDFMTNTQQRRITRRYKPY